MADKVLNFKIPEELHKKIKEEANKKSLSMAALVRLILIEYFKKK